jgi:hypothetical protein
MRQDGIAQNGIRESTDHRDLNRGQDIMELASPW